MPCSGALRDAPALSFRRSAGKLRRAASGGQRRHTLGARQNRTTARERWQTTHRVRRRCCRLWMQESAHLPFLVLNREGRRGVEPACQIEHAACQTCQKTREAQESSAPCRRALRRGMVCAWGRSPRGVDGAARDAPRFGARDTDGRASAEGRTAEGP